MTFNMLHEKFELSIYDRLHLGPLIGFEIVPRDESHDWNEFNIYVIFFVICYKWWK
jgi:hypothetical protein